MAGWYAYCVRKRTGKGERSPGVTVPVGGTHRALAIVSYQDIEAMVAQVPIREFSGASGRERWDDAEWLKTKALAHAQVVEEVMRRTPPVIPFKLGVVFRSRERLTAALRTHHQRFRQLLRQLHGRTEWGVQLFADDEVLVRVYARGDDRTQQLRRAIRRAPAGKAYLLGKELDAYLRGAAQSQQERLTQDFFQMAQACRGSGRCERGAPASGHREE